MRVWVHYICVHTTAHTWRSEGNFRDLAIFHLSVAGSVLFLLLHCVPQAGWPMIFRVILLSLPPICQQECWDCRCVPWHPALHGFWRPWAAITFTGWVTFPALVYAVLAIASSLKVTRTRGCVQAGNVHNMYTILHMETSSTDAPATISTAHTEKQLDWVLRNLGVSWLLSFLHQRNQTLESKIAIVCSKTIH